MAWLAWVAVPWEALGPPAPALKQFRLKARRAIAGESPLFFSPPTTSQISYHPRGFTDREGAPRAAPFRPVRETPVLLSWVECVRTEACGRGLGGRQERALSEPGGGLAIHRTEFGRIPPKRPDRGCEGMHFVN